MEEENTIELIDLLRVLWKWKWMIILATFVCMVAAGAFSIMMPKIYEAYMTIEPAIISVDKSGRYIYLGTPQNIEEKIRKGVYNKRIKKELKIDSSKMKLGFKVDRQKSADLIKVTSEWEEDKIDLGLNVLRQLASFLSEGYEKIIEQKKGDYDKQVLMEQNKIREIKTQRKDIDKQITLKFNDIQEKRSQIRFQQSSLKITRQREKELMQEIKKVKDNTEKIVRERDILLKSGNFKYDISLLLYSTTIQQNVVYFNRLNDQINDLKTKKEKIGTEVEKLNKEIDDINTEIERLNLEKTEGLQTKIDDSKAKIDRLALEKGLIENVKIIQAPEASLRPIKPKKKLNVILACVIGLIISIILAFFLEYLQKMGVYPKSSSTPKQTASVKNQEK